MKSTKLFIFFLFFVTATSSMAQSSASDSTGLPGDNFDLAGALELFKKAGSPEDFEKLLNSEKSNVNNLDLNGDGEIDYIKVLDKKDGDAHAFVLQDAVSETENQDVAVIDLEKNGSENVAVQIVGDKDLYGEEIAYEPSEAEVAQDANVAPVVNVYSWPMVRYVYAPTYAIWISPFRWRMHPMWWHPWRPVAYRVFYPYRVGYHHRYVVAYRPRLVVAHRIYAPARTTSAMVQSRNAVRVNQYRSTRVTRATTVSNRNGSVTRKSTTVRGRRGGKVTRTKTRVRKN